MNCASDLFRLLSCCLVLAVAFTLNGCQSVSSVPPTNPAPPPPPPPPPSVSISIQQSSVNVAAGTTMQFAASVTGTTNKAVTWAVDAAVGGNVASGLIDVSGMYGAPPVAGTHTVTATSAADTTKSASSAVTVTNTSSVSPASVTLMAGATQTFSASFPALSNPSLTWSVDNIAGGNSSVGVISTAGLYTAPSLAGSHAVAATDANTGVSTSAAPVTVFTMSTSPSL